MKKRLNNKLPNNLPQLQNLIKRDPVSYRDEFLQQLNRYEATLQIFQLRPDDYDKVLEEQLIFLAQVGHCYVAELSNYPQQLMQLLQQHHSVLNPYMRSSIVKALVLLRNKNLVNASTLLELFFQLLNVPDKGLRKFLKLHIISDIKNTNSKHKNLKLNRILQNFLYSMLQDSSAIAAKVSIDIMIELYHKQVWNDAKTVNVIATGLFSKVTKVLVTALKFFLGKDEDEKNKDDDSDDDVTVNDLTGTRSGQLAKKLAKKNGKLQIVSKKTRKRLKMVAQAKKTLKRKRRNLQAPEYNFSALHLLHDPQDIAERLLKRLEGANERFEVKMMVLDLVSRLVGVHQLLVLNLYPLLQRFLQPHQRDVTRVLRCAAQSAHELVPPDDLEPVLYSIANNFVSDRNSAECMAVGLNSIRELCSRCPLAMPKELLTDLTGYKTHKDKSVNTAARSLISLYRESNPDILIKKHRGRPTQESDEVKLLQYGELGAKDYIPGAEVLEPKDDNESEKSWESTSEDEDESDGEWVDVQQSDDEETVKTEISLTKEERIEKAREVSSNVILSQDDVKKIKIAQMKKQMSKADKKGGKKRNVSQVEEEPETVQNPELVPMSAIERVHKRIRSDKETRLASVLMEREKKPKWKREQKKSENASTSNREKLKTKNFMMIKHKVKGKHKRSFRDKQVALRDALVKQRRLLLVK